MLDQDDQINSSEFYPAFVLDPLCVAEKMTSLGQTASAQLKGNIKVQHDCAAMLIKNRVLSDSAPHGHARS